MYVSIGQIGLKMDWNSLQVASPRESMHSELLLHLNRNDAQLSDRKLTPHFEIAAWLKLKNTEQLPAILLLEYTDRSGTHWQILDTATLRTSKGTVLLSGVLDPKVKHLSSVDVYLCHPSPFIQCEIEEIRFNNQLMHLDYLIDYNVA